MNSDDIKMASLYFTVLFAIVSVLAAIHWFMASIQRDVYARQGVEMTTFEIFMGAKPVERYVKEKQ